MPLKILIVDDSATDNKRLSDIVVQAGYSAYTAMDGDEGFRLSQSLLPDLILMDVVMPGMNGFQACKKILQQPLTQHIPIIMVSNKYQDTDLLWAKKQGAKGYFSKPVQADELLQHISALLNQP